MAHDVWNLSEWLDRSVRCGLLFAFGQVDRGQLVWDVLFLADEGNEAGACGTGETVQLDHCVRLEVGVMMVVCDDGYR